MARDERVGIFLRRDHGSGACHSFNLQQTSTTQPSTPNISLTSEELMYSCGPDLRVAHSVRPSSLLRILRHFIPDATNATQPLGPCRDATFLTHNHLKRIYQEHTDEVEITNNKHLVTRSEIIHLQWDPQDRPQRGSLRHPPHHPRRGYPHRRICKISVKSCLPQVDPRKNNLPL